VHVLLQGAGAGDKFMEIALFLVNKNEKKPMENWKNLKVKWDHHSRMEDRT
jgi:hypothetical protein